MSRINDLIKKMCPNGVEHKQLNKIADTFIGLATSVTKHKTSDGVILLHNSDIKQNKIVLKTIEFIDKGFADKNVNKYYQYHDIATVHTGDVGTSAVIEEEYVGSMGFTTLVTRIYDFNYLNPYYLCHYFNSQLFKNDVARVTISDRSNLNQKEFCQLSIPIPPIEVQEEIVRILDTFGDLEAELEAELEARKSQYEFWREKLLNTGNSNQEYITLGDIGKVCMCKRIMKNETSDSGDVPFYKIGTFGKQADAYISYDIFNDYKNRFSYPKKGEILVSCSGTIGKSVVFDGEDAYFQDSNIVWLSNDESKVLNKFLYYFYQTSPWNISDGGTIKRLYNKQFISAKVPLYSLEEQKKIVNILERFDGLINDITIGLPAEIELRKQQYEYYRNKLLSFEELYND